MSATNIDAMSARAFCSGLMRGNRKDLQRGYDPVAAADAVRRRRSLTDEEFERLLDYARGFSNGMRAAIQRDDPDYYATLPGPDGVTPLDADHRARAADPDAPRLAESPDRQNWNAGFVDGFQEPGDLIFPTITNTVV